MPGYPVLLHTAIDARDCRGLAEFYRDLRGLHHRAGEDPLYVMADPAGHPFCLLVQ